jgi:dephospho-CoA kinase
MDDFIVDETESEPDFPEKGGRRKKKEKFVAYSNVVILTGVHGTGKSAAVEAVAEECGYQVFEISPGSRRGAKELMEAVGEVGQSELVTKHRAVETAPRLLRTAEQEEEEERKKGRKAMVCLDEVDVLYEEDRGFWGCVTGLVERSRRPLVMTCNGMFFPLLRYRG